MENETYQALIRSRRSTRLFQERPVPAEVVRRIIDAAIHAPTACNRQLWHFVVITDPAMKQKVSRMGDAGSQSYLYDAPTLIAVFYDTSMESRNPCYTPYITTGMAIYGLLLAAEAEGLGAIYLGGIMDPKGAAKAVEAPAHLQNLGIVCLGYRADEPPAPNIRPVDEVISYNICGPVKKRCHPDIRPHVWTLDQLADFRDKLLWYKGIGIDAKTLHVNPDPRFSPKLIHLSRRLGMLIAQYNKPRVLDVFSHNGDLLLQLLNSCAPDIETLFAYDLTPGIARYVQERFKFILASDKLEFLTNPFADHLRIPLPDNSVDIISCYERLGHFDDPTPLLNEMHRVLRPGGRALVLTSNRYYPHRYRYMRSLKKNYALGRNWDFGPERLFAPQVINALYRQAGFTIQSITGLQPLNMKFVSVAQNLCRRAGWHALGDWFQDRHAQMYCTRTLTRFVSQTMLHELTKA